MTFGGTFEGDGLALFPQSISKPAIQQLREFAGDRKNAGERLDAVTLAPIAGLIRGDGPIGQIASLLLGRRGLAVRAILFDKSPETNWSLGWHQDRTINVAERVDVSGFGPWTVKHGLLHAQPPQSVIDAMITVRVHLDDVLEGNGPLRVLVGSHRLGRLLETEIAELASRSEPSICLAISGDVWAYRTAIVHSSRPVESGSLGRRVFQLDYAGGALSPPLRWAMTI